MASSLSSVEAALNALRRAPDGGKVALETLVKIVGNICANSNEPKYRKLRLENSTMQTKVFSVSGGIELLYAVGFERVEGDLILPPTASLVRLLQARQAIEEALKPKLTTAAPTAPAAAPAAPVAPVVPVAPATQAAPAAPAAPTFSTDSIASMLNNIQPAAPPPAATAAPTALAGMGGATGGGGFTADSIASILASIPPVPAAPPQPSRTPPLNLVEVLNLAAGSCSDAAAHAILAEHLPQVGARIPSRRRAQERAPTTGMIPLYPVVPLAAYLASQLLHLASLTHGRPRVRLRGAGLGLRR